MPKPESDQAHITEVLATSGVDHETEVYDDGDRLFAYGAKPSRFANCQEQPGVRFDFDQDGKLLEIAIWH